MNKKSFLVIIVVVVVLFVAVGVWIGVRLGRVNVDGPSPYSAVYLVTGDVYFGKLSWFPSARLDDAWLLQRTVGADGQAQFGLVPLSSAFWGPVGTVYLRREQVVFWTRLTNASQVAQALQNPAAFQAPTVQPPRVETPPAPLPQNTEQAPPEE